jgi:MFS transporter, UMF1 family
VKPRVATSRLVGSAVTAEGREQIGWCFYDWANSAFATTVVTVFLGPYLTTVTRAAADGSGFVHPLGVPIHAGAFFPYLVSLSVLLQIVVLPILGAIADYTHLKKQMLALFAYVGAFATMGLYFLSGTNYLLGGGLFVVANVSFGASIVVYNAFLPQIAGPDRRNFVSSLGWGLGYLGGGLLLALNLALFSRAGSLGLTTGEAVRISLLSAGMWWALFTIVPLATLRNQQPARNSPKDVRIIGHGFRQLRHTFRQMRHYPQTLTFLIAYLLYNDGIQTVIALSTVFGQEELGIDIATLTTVILMVQFIGFFGTLLFHRIAATIGTKRAIVTSLLIWTGTLIFAFGFMWTTSDFFILAGVIALVLGGSQALSRSAFSMMIPPGKEAEYFSLYEVSERGTSWLGPLVFGLSLQFTGSYRIAILSLIVFFVAGLALLTRVDIRRGAVEAGNQAPSLG